jgi:hypothetical protein
MIYDGNTSNIEGGMLIDWDLSKKVDPEDERTFAHQHSRTVSSIYKMHTGLMS